MLAGVGAILLIAFGFAIAVLQPGGHPLLALDRTPLPDLPPGAHAHLGGPRYVDLPMGYRASMYASPVDGGLVGEWHGGTPVVALGPRFHDGYGDWLLVRDPTGRDGWIGEVFLGAEPPRAAGPAPAGPGVEETFVGPVRWAGPIRFCVNPTGGPAGLDDDAFVRLVEQAAERWRALVDGRLPLESLGRCGSDPNDHADGATTVGWAPDLGLMIAALTWPDVESGVAGEMDVVLSRGFFERLRLRDPTRTLRACVLSTTVHELGHVLGLDHPRDRLLPSSMQAVGASRCDKGRPTAADRANLLRLYPAAADEQVGP